MQEKENPVCPNCGAVMVERELDTPTLLDGSSPLDGTTQLGGYYCPNLFLPPSVFSLPVFS